MAVTTTVDDDLDPGATTLPGQTPRGATLGRYVVLDRLGAGGMGVVYAAYDPKLDRRVALKLLHHGADETRLLREAQALARLSHPNVVAVHDVGTIEPKGAARMGLARGEHVFVAMEYVDGLTLTDWLKSDARTPAQILDVLTRAGTGLAAAHGAGLVHRDFKPDNVMVGHDGRVRVMDFGLARTETTTTPAEASLDEVASSGEVLSSPLTRTGAVLGTPAYMAPEQHRGTAVDARSDQFAFCVTAHEALYGVRPFEGKTVAAIVLAVGQGKVVDPPADTKVPTAVRNAILRGLAVDASARWPSMSALLAALQGPPKRRRGLLGIAGLGVGVAGVGAWLANAEPAPTKCATAGDEIRQIWDDDRRAGIGDAFGELHLRFADDAWTRVGPTLDAYATQWSATRRAACEATQVAGTQSERLLDLRMACLDRRYGQLDALLGQLETVDAKMAQRATGMVGNLVPIAACSDVEHLEAPRALPDDPRTREGVDEVRSRLDELAALLWAGKYPEALAPAAEIVTAARQTEYAPVIAEALAAYGRTLDGLSDPKATEVLHEAIVAAAQGHNDEIAVDAWARLIKITGARDGNVEQAKAWARAAEAAAIRAGDDPADRVKIEIALGEVLMRGEDRKGAAEAFARAREFFAESGVPGTPQYARMLVVEGIVLSQDNQIDAAEASFREALALYEELGGQMHPNVADVLNNLGTQLSRRKKLDEAEVMFRRAIEIGEAAQGPDNPDLLGPLFGLSSVAKSRRRDDDAQRLAARARDIATKAFGEDHPSTAFALERLGEVLAVSDPPRSIEPLQQALKIRERMAGPDHITTTWARLELANAYGKMGDNARAIEELEAISAIIEQAHGPEAENLGKPYVLLAEYCRKEGRFAQAKAWADKSLAVYRAVFGEGHRDLTYPQAELAKIAAAQGDFAGAIAQQLKVVELRRAAEVPPPDLAAAMEELARWYRDAGDLAEARTWADQAIAALEAVEDGRSEQLAGVRALRAELGGG